MKHTTTQESEMTASQPEMMDLNTAEGCVAWMKELPTDNLKTIAARPVDRFNILIVCAAEGELIVRGEQ
jgi:hypothetical protein